MITLIAKLNYNEAIDNGYQLATEQAPATPRMPKAISTAGFQLPKHLAGRHRGHTPHRQTGPQADRRDDHAIAGQRAAIHRAMDAVGA
ncbi:hypothetical protein [Chromobacterium amazonense]|uniref:hypothetical protein n=1 Tax=Chromobacterium amazonense TaxID=1382803 RepID=UPI0011139E95|nr:hypothetical protein [Chromobacterium amazonense]